MVEWENLFHIAQYVGRRLVLLWWRIQNNRGSLWTANASTWMATNLWQHLLEWKNNIFCLSMEGLASLVIIPRMMNSLGLSQRIPACSRNHQWRQLEKLPRQPERSPVHGSKTSQLDGFKFSPICSRLSWYTLPWATTAKKEESNQLAAMKCGCYQTWAVWSGAGLLDTPENSGREQVGGARCQRD